jgi:hypothetical protein
MAVQMRDPVTTTTPCSRYVQEGAIRLFTKGYTAKLTYVETPVRGIFTYQLPSESEPGVTYTIDYDIDRAELHCSCPAGQHNVPCKHVELFRLSRGLVNREGRA